MKTVRTGLKEIFEQASADITQKSDAHKFLGFLHL